MDTPQDPVARTAEEVQVFEAAKIEKKTHQTRMILFGLLILCSTIPLFLTLGVPNKPTQSTVDLYSTLMSVPDNSTVLLQTDWTLSTRGESGGEFEGLMRVLMRKNCKIALYSMSDAQAPQVAIDEIALLLNPERKAKGEREYKAWDDYISLGFFPNAEGETASMAANLRSAWTGKKAIDVQGQEEDVFQSPVLKNVQTIANVPLVVIITATNSFNVLIERLAGKVPVIALVTGVMGPESNVYYSSKQIQGLAIGMKGVYDLETMMEEGINSPGKDGKVAFEWPNHPPVAGFPGETNYGRGKLYFPTLHIDMTLMILAVIFGNVGMFMAKKRGNR
ncbi:MAG TPA: hypothetical protein VGL56_11150 [Fimbriimonadaceae bacterium]|jgi:hypothetical protein